MESAKTMQLLSELFYSGLKSIEKYPNMAATFGMSPEMWRYIDDAGRIKKFIQALPMRASSNPDHFYGAMHAGLTNGFDPSAEAISEIFRGLGEGKYPKALFEQTYSKFKLDTSLRECFIPEGNYYSSLADAELKSAVTDQFQIAYKSLLSSPRDESFVFTKINHGYWEHFLSVYATSFAQRSAAGEYRALEREGYVLRYSASGFDGILAHVLQQTVDPKNSDMSGRKISQRLSISFCAGESPCAITLKNPLTPVSRAAMAGALTFFKSVTKLAPLILGDGSEAKSLIDN
ncbi:MAG: hypothetical protein KJ899_11990, partial [Gammaproteobacteria bacterium]|nr:hypothetical protein [Gammaproteobacteria bacterium]